MQKSKREILQYVEKKLSQLGVNETVLEAAELLSFALSLSRKELLQMEEISLTIAQETALADLVAKRKAGVPLPYLIGEWDFYGETFSVGPGVLIPRGDTERLIDVLLEKADPKKSYQIVDLCSGTGCIGLTAARLFPNSQVICVEWYDEALVYLKKNHEKYSNLYHSEYKKLDVLNKEMIDASFLENSIDILLSNPPYIGREEIAMLSDSLKYEPSSALFAENDGFAFYEGILSLWNEKIRTDGIVIFEIGYTQSSRVESLLFDYDYQEVETIKDFGGRPRVVYGRKRNL